MAKKSLIERAKEHIAIQTFGLGERAGDAIIMYIEDFSKQNNLSQKQRQHLHNFYEDKKRQARVYH